MILDNAQYLNIQNMEKIHGINWPNGIVSVALIDLCLGYSLCFICTAVLYSEIMCSLIVSHDNGSLCFLEYNIPPPNEENESMVSNFLTFGQNTSFQKEYLHTFYVSNFQLIYLKSTFWSL